MMIDRIRKLIQQASSPEKEEARTAAFVACELIRNSDIVLLTETELRGLQEERDRLRHALVLAEQKVWELEKGARAKTAPVNGSGGLARTRKRRKRSPNAGLREVAATTAGDLVQGLVQDMLRKF